MTEHEPQTLSAKRPDGKLIYFDDYVKAGDKVSIYEWFDDIDCVYDGGSMGFEEMIVMHTFDDGWTLRPLTKEEIEEHNNKVLST